MKNKRIAVVSAGAIGASLAADIALAGWDVTIIDTWPEHIEVVRRDGLTVKHINGSVQKAKLHALHACDIATLRDDFDVVFIAAKAYDTRWIAELVKPVIGPDTLVVGVQNSLCDEEIAKILGRSRVIGCVVELAAEIFDPGTVVRHTAAGSTWFGLGALDPATQPRVAEIEELMCAGARVSIMDNIEAAKWTKLIANAVILGPVGIVGTTIAAAFSMPEMRSLAAQIGREAVDIAKSHGHAVQPVFGLKAEDLQGPADVVAQKLVDTIVGHIGKAARSCVLQDHMKGRYSEVDKINGLIVDFGKARGVEAPYNQRVVDITDRIFLGEIVPSTGNLSLLMPTALESQ